MAMAEQEVVSSVKGWLVINGWSILWANHRKRGAPDIGAEKNNSCWFIETKGDAKNDIPNQDANFYCALGQILVYKTDAHAKYSIAFADAPRYRKRWQELPLAARCAANSCLFVSAGQVVTEVT